MYVYVMYFVIIIIIIIKIIRIATGVYPVAVVLQ
jgi:hypothetical protein